MEPRRIIVGVSGASGSCLAVSLLTTLRAANVETHLIISRGGMITAGHELGSADVLRKLAFKCYDNDDIGAAPASGSFRTDGMAVVPCSMKTAAGIASGYSDSLLLRAADVTLKERRTLVLAARESPMSAIHLRNLRELAICGAVIMPPLMQFYTKPEDIGDMVSQFTLRVLDQFGIDSGKIVRWSGIR